MEKSTQMVAEIFEKRKISKTIVKKIINKIFFNVIIAICLVTWNLFINTIYLYANLDVSSIILKICALVTISVSIIMFEIAYRKDSMDFLFFGIEFFINSVIVLTIPKIYEHLENIMCTIFLLYPVFCVIYYTIKSFIIYKFEKVNYERNLSDIKEIRRLK